MWNRCCQWIPTVELVASSVHFLLLLFQHKIVRIFLTIQWILHTNTLIMTERVIVTMRFLWNFSKFSLSFFSVLFAKPNEIHVLCTANNWRHVVWLNVNGMSRWERLSELCQIHEIEGKTRWKKEILIAKMFCHWQIYLRPDFRGKLKNCYIN